MCNADNTHPELPPGFMNPKPPRVGRGPTVHTAAPERTFGESDAPEQVRSQPARYGLLALTATTTRPPRNGHESHEPNPIAQPERRRRQKIPVNMPPKPRPIAAARRRRCEPATSLAAGRTCARAEIERVTPLLPQITCTSCTVGNREQQYIAVSEQSTAVSSCSRNARPHRPPEPCAAGGRRFREFLLHKKHRMCFARVVRPYQASAMKSRAGRLDPQQR